MAGSTTYPGSVDNKTAKVDGVDIIEADDINDAYVPIDAIETMIGGIGSGKTQSWSVDLLELLSNQKAPVCTKTDASTISVSAGTVVIKNSGQSIRMLRRTTSAISVTASNWDGNGTLAVGFNYIYAVADSAATTFTIKISASSSAPSSTTNYELIGWFYNESSAAVDITSGFIGNVKGNGRNPQNSLTVIGTSNITTTSSSDVLMTNMQLRFYTSGRPVLILFDAIFEGAGNGTQVQSAIYIAGAEKRRDCEGGASGTQAQRLQIHYVETLAAGGYLIEAYWKRLSGSDTIQQNGGTYKRELTVIEL